VGDGSKTEEAQRGVQKVAFPDKYNTDNYSNTNMQNSHKYRVIVHSFLLLIINFNDQSISQH